METISPQTFCYTKVKVGPKTIPPPDVSALHASWTFQAESQFSPPKDFFAPNNFGPYTFWYQNILAFDIFWIFG